MGSGALCVEFAWQARHFGLYAGNLRGRRGTWSFVLGICVAWGCPRGRDVRSGVVRCRAWAPGLYAGNLRGRRGTWSSVLGIGGAGAALGHTVRCRRGDMDRDFVWQASHLVTWTLTFCGGCVTYGIGLVLATRWVAAGRHLCVAGVALVVTWTFADNSLTQNSLTHNSLTHNSLHTLTHKPLTHTHILLTHNLLTHDSLTTYFHSTHTHNSLSQNSLTHNLATHN